VLRTFVISDLHGNDKVFFQWLKDIEFNIKTDDLIIAGDVFDRGTGSFKILDWIIKNEDNCTLIMGNHEEMFLDLIENMKQYLTTQNTSNYLHENGMLITLLQWVDMKEKNRQKYRFAIDNTCFFTILNKGNRKFFISHAGLKIIPACNGLIETIQHTDLTDLCWSRTGKLYTEPNLVQIFGHTPTFTGEVVEEEDYCFNIDGGCIFTNNLNYITIFSDGKFSIKQFKLDTM
jgi:predicted phosphodiesterase